MDFENFENFEKFCEYENHIRDAAHNVEAMKKRFLDEAERPGTPLRHPVRYDDIYAYACGVYYEDSKYTEEGLLFVLQSLFYLKNADDALAWTAAVKEIWGEGTDFKVSADFAKVEELFFYYSQHIKDFPDKELAYCEYCSWFDIWRSIADIELYYSNVFCDSAVFISRIMEYFFEQIKILEDEWSSVALPRYDPFKSYVNGEDLFYSDDGEERFNEDHIVTLLKRCEYLIHELEYKKTCMRGLLDALTISVDNERDFLYERYKSSLCASPTSRGYASPDSIDRLGELALRGVVDDIIWEKFNNRDKEFKTNICLIEKLRSSLSDWLTTRADIVNEVINHGDCFCHGWGEAAGGFMRHDFVVYYLENTVELYSTFISALTCAKRNGIKLPYLNKTTPPADMIPAQLLEDICLLHRFDFGDSPYFIGRESEEDENLVRAIAQERKRANERQGVKKECRIKLDYRRRDHMK